VENLPRPPLFAWWPSTRCHDANDGEPGRTDGTDHDMIEAYVWSVASVAELVNLDTYPSTREYDVTKPLPDELPADVTPEARRIHASWLEPAINRARELLVLLQRRSLETSADR
jgi:hypothetical protein